MGKTGPAGHQSSILICLGKNFKSTYFEKHLRMAAFA